jgi:hypothetical protein
VTAPAKSTGIALYWLPLGAGGHSVRWNGRIFEWLAARLDRRDRCDLYHSALEVRVPEGRFVIEQAPAWSESTMRGVVAEGAVGSRALGRFRLFRYEIRADRAQRARCRVDSPSTWRTRARLAGRDRDGTPPRRRTAHLRNAAHPVT